MKLIVGLGNVGEKYKNTRHNIAWLVLDKIHLKFGGTWQKGHNFASYTLHIDGEKVFFLKPHTFMNFSGDAVLSFVNYYKISLNDLLIIQDDLDSDFGALKIKFAGGHGGQNGLKHIIQVLKDDKFARLKLGISRPPQNFSASDWVLSNWQPSEMDILQEITQEAVSATIDWIKKGTLESQQVYNQKKSCKKSIK